MINLLYININSAYTTIDTLWFELKHLLGTEKILFVKYSLYIFTNTNFIQSLIIGSKKQFLYLNI